MAVYTKLTKDEIINHLKNYQIGELLEFKEIVEGIDNSNFILKTTKGKYILTVFEARIDKEQLPFFINLKLHLSKKGISCPEPILDNKGLAIVEIKEKKSIIASFLSGATLKPKEDGYYNSITPKHCFEVGKQLAKMHEAARDFSMNRENELGIKGFRIFFTKFSNLVEENLREEILANLDFIETNSKLELPSAAAHADLFPDNVFFDENSNLSGVIDFYFAANDFLIYDFAIVANAWCFDEKNNFIVEKFTQLKKGYLEIRKFAPAEESFLKIALVAAAMRFLLTRLHDKIFTPKDSLVKIKNPQEYLEKLRFFRNSI